MDTSEFREAMQRLTEKIVYINENTSEGEYIDFGKLQDEFNDLATTYLDIIW